MQSMQPDERSRGTDRYRCERLDKLDTVVNGQRILILYVIPTCQLWYGGNIDR